MVWVFNDYSPCQLKLAAETLEYSSDIPSLQNRACEHNSLHLARKYPRTVLFPRDAHADLGTDVHRQISYFRAK